MSHIVTIAVEIRDLEAVRRACNRLGWTFHEGQTAYKWFGYWYGDTVMPQGILAPGEQATFDALKDEADKRVFLTERLGVCEHAISVPGCEYQIGLIRKLDGSYIPMWDYFCTGGLDKVLGCPEHPEVVNPFPRVYALEAAGLEAERMGYAWEYTTLENGDYLMTVHTPGEGGY